MKNKILKFPDGFLWGAATSAYQIEGGNKNDWSEWEKKNAQRLAKEAKSKWQKWQRDEFPEMLQPDNYICQRACDHYNHYEEDLDIAASLNLNAFRISFEWSRIEPREGKFDDKEIKHYRKVIEAIRSRKMEPFVTLWHTTNPLWIAKNGGITDKRFPFYFSRYAKFVAKNFKSSVKFWITLNEPTSVIWMSFLAGTWPPQKKNLFSSLKAFKNFGKAHMAAYNQIKSTNSDAKIGFNHLFRFIEPKNKQFFLDRLSANIANYFANKEALNSLMGKSDFIALQYYFHDLVKFPFQRKNKNKYITDLGWEIFPEGIYHSLKDLKKYNLPVYVTENGLADATDKYRVKFIKDHLYWIHKAINEGCDVRGYFHWSLLDNFEWDEGFWPRFGLVEVNYGTLERKIRPSARVYSHICKNNSIDISK